MKILKLYHYLGFFPLTFLESEKLHTYKLEVYNTILEIAKKEKSRAYSKYFLHMRFKKIDGGLTNFIKLYKKTFSEEELKFLKVLLNITKHIKRFVINKGSHLFPAIFLDLTSEELVKYAQQYKIEYELKGENLVLALTDIYYTKLAETMSEKAERLLELELAKDEKHNKNYENKNV